jgi:glc operon protein GlcG
MRMKPCLTNDDVLKMAAACRQKGAELASEPTIAIVDAAGHLLYLERPAGSGVNTVEVATRKARTAALSGRPSGAFGQRVRERPEFLLTPEYLGVQGGVPVIFEGECIGGVGVSGISKGDEVAAEAGAAALGT